MTAPLPTDEAERLDELRKYKILDTPPEASYDDLVYVASQICGTPIALMSLIDTHRQYLKPNIGLPITETSRDVAFCAHAIVNPELMIVPDATNDARFVDNPLVTSDPNIRFYAGAPLTTPGGHAMGTLCVIDRVPRTLTLEQQKGLAALSRQVVALLQLRLAKEAAEQASALKTELLDKLGVEQARSERLLQSLFPKPIAERLKHEGPGCIADEYDAVTVLFASICGFWKIAEAMPPRQFIDLLSEVFSVLDRVTEEHGVLKIRTISDCYMAVAGVPEPRPDHAEAVAELALSIQRELARMRTPSRDHFNVRIGVHSGPVVAGVIGMRKLAYDLWGPSVNLASHLEAFGVAGGIQVTGATRNLLKDKYFFEKRSDFYVDGVGDIETYLLRGRRAR